MDDRRSLGHVKIFDNEKGLGIITGDDLQEYSVCKAWIRDERKLLFRKQPVSFLREIKRQQLSASDVIAIDLFDLDSLNLKHWIESAHSQTKTLDKEEYVYVIKGHNMSAKVEVAYKIGRSENKEAFRRRVHDLRRKYPHPIRPIHTIATNYSLWLEQTLHRTFALKKGGGPSWEWFKLDDSAIIWLKSLDRIDVKLLYKIVENDIGKYYTEQLMYGRGQ